MADTIGPEVELAFHTPAQAIQLLELNYPGFIQNFADGHFFVSAQTPVGERDMRKENLLMGFTGDLVIMPAAYGNASGKRKGLLGAILGAVIIGAAFFLSGGTLGAALPGVLGSGLGATWGSIAKLGLALLANGIAQVLTPTPDTDYDGVDEARSFIFNGPTNIATPGGPLPLIYGKHMTGTITVSAAMDIEMLKGGFGQRPLTATFPVIRTHQSTVVVDMEDLMNKPEGCVLTHLDGNEITSTPFTYTKNTRTEVTVSNTSGDNLIFVEYTPPEGESSSPVITTLGLGGTRYSFEATITHEGDTYTSTFYVGYGLGALDSLSGFSFGG